MTGYDIITTRTYHFDDNGTFSKKRIVTGSPGTWEVTVAEREILIPEIIIFHIHALASRTTNYSVPSFLKSIDIGCSCGKKLPANILNDIYTKHKHCYSAIERPAYYRLDLLKMLADNWYLDENKQQKKPALFHVCNLNHPAYFYYGKGIPISQIAMPPWEDKCKTCHQDIPKGIRMALLLLSKRISLR